MGAAERALATMITKINLGLAFAAVMSPTWLKFLGEMSPALSLVLQALGITLALLQIIKLLKEWKLRK
jgi:hypothetical protein